MREKSSSPSMMPVQRPTSDSDDAEIFDDSLAAASGPRRATHRGDLHPPIIASGLLIFVHHACRELFGTGSELLRSGCMAR